MTGIVHLIDLADLVRGVSYDKNEVKTERAEGYVPIMRAGNISEILDTESDLVWVPKRFVSSDQIIKEGDIAICMSSGSASVVGKSAISYADWHGSVGAFCAVIRAKSEKCLPRYLGFFLRSAQFRRWTSESVGANIKNIKKSDLAEFQIPYVAMDEQRRIVDTLSRAEGIVRLQQQALDRAKALIPALFVELFGDPATNPKGWPVVTLGDVLSACDYGSSSKAGDDSNGYPVLRMGNVTYAGELDDSNLKYIELDDTEYQKYALQAGDILFNRTNSKDLVGKTGLWNGRYPAIAASYFIRLRISFEQATPEYVWAYMNLPYMKRVMFETARGAIGQANINTKELKAFALPLPARNVQQEFTDRLADAQSIITQQSAALTKSRELFDALLAQTFAPTGAV